jgi:3-oxoacyl-[acyl-carrier protein] reductase
VSLSTTVTEAARETYSAEQLEKMVVRYPMRRLGTPADAVGMIMFLMGDEASWITGQTFSVNGGYAIL